MLTFIVPGTPQGKGRPRVSTIAVARLREVFAYDPVSGVLTWRLKTGPRSVVGAQAGSKHCGYLSVGLDGVRSVKVHRIAWALHFGAWPEMEIDHIDGNGLNNAIANLRLATPAQNHENMRRHRSDNKLGALGVSMHKGRILAQIQARGRKHFIGYYSTVTEAHAAYVAKKRELHEFGTL